MISDLLPFKCRLRRDIFHAVVSVAFVENQVELVRPPLTPVRVPLTVLMTGVLSHSSETVVADMRSMFV